MNILHIAGRHFRTSYGRFFFVFNKKNVLKILYCKKDSNFFFCVYDSLSIGFDSFSVILLYSEFAESYQSSWLIFRVSDSFFPDPKSDPDWIRIQSGQLIRIHIQEGKKRKKGKKFHVLKCWMLSSEG